jgi:hypothetical protein
MVDSKQGDDLVNTESKLVPGLIGVEKCFAEHYLNNWE